MIVVNKNDLQEILGEILKNTAEKHFQDRLLTPEDTAELLSVNVSFLKSRMPLPKTYVGREIRYKLSDVNSFISTGTR